MAVPPVAFWANDILDYTESATAQRVIQRDLMYNIYTLMNVGFSLQTALDGGALAPLIPYRDDFLENDRAVTGFPENGTPTKIYYCAIYTPENIVLAACLFIGKAAAYEIWSLASNPLYLRTGAAGLLIKNLCFRIWRTGLPLYLSVASDSYPFITFYDRLLFYGDLGFNCADASTVFTNVRDEPIPLNSITFTSYLQGVTPPAAAPIIADNSGVGDEVVMTDADTRPLETSVPVGESGVHMLVDGDSAAAPPILTKNSVVRLGNEAADMPLYQLKTRIQLMSSIPGQRYVMRVVPNTMNRNRLIIDTLVLQGTIAGKSHLLLPSYNAKCARYRALLNERIGLIKALTNKPSLGALPREYHNIGVISHSRCDIHTINRIRQIKSYKLPPNVELITINTLGYSTYGGTIKHAWDAFQRYLLNIPIEILKQYCPGVRPEKSGGYTYLPAPAQVVAGAPLQAEDFSFINSVKASLRYKFTDISGEPYVQFNAYGPGDLVPDFHLCAEVLTPGIPCADFISPIAGFYESNSTFRNLTTEEIADFMPQLAPVTVDGVPMILSICVNGIPDSKKGILKEGVGTRRKINDRYYWDLDLSTFIEIIKSVEMFALPSVPSKEKRIRILIISCATTVDRSDPGNLTNSRMQELTSKMSGRTILTEMGGNLAGQYRRDLMGFGHMLLNRILGSLLGTTIAHIPYDPEAVEAEATAFATEALVQSGYVTPGGGGYRKRKSILKHRSKRKTITNWRRKSKSKATRKGRR